MSEKCCNSCHKTKPEEEFIRHKKSFGCCNDCAELNHRKYEEKKDVIKHRNSDEERKQHKKEYNKKYYERTKQTRNKQTASIQDNKKPYECECGAIVRYGNRARHFKTDKHKALMNFSDKVEELLVKHEENKLLKIWM